MSLEVIVAGHIALDVIPDFLDQTGKASKLKPGELIEVGKASFNSGGCVSNTGLALARLGVSVRLLGCVGDDEFGGLILQTIRNANANLVESIAVIPAGVSSYTIVLNPPLEDRIFFHCPGINHYFTSNNIKLKDLEGAQIFHFGYPPLMRQMYSNNGKEMIEIFKKVKELNLITSLDMAMPGSAEARTVDWKRWLQQVLPYVDLFFPSLDELLLMFPEFKERSKDEAIRTISQQLLDFGSGIVTIKIGEFGLYCRTSSHARLKSIPHLVIATEANWHSRELWAPCFKVGVIGTTGAGDCTIAGFIKGVIEQLPIEQVMNGAVAVGACNVEAYDALSGLIPWEQLQERIREGWLRSDNLPKSSDWIWDHTNELWKGSFDSTL